MYTTHMTMHSKHTFNNLSRDQNKKKGKWEETEGEAHNLIIKIGDSSKMQTNSILEFIKKYEKLHQEGSVRVTVEFP